MPNFRIGDKVKLVHQQNFEEYPLPLELGDVGTIIEVEYEEEPDDFNDQTLMAIRFDRDNGTYFIYDWEVEHA